MAELLGIAPSQLFGQLLLGLINGACYAMLSLGLAIIFGLLNIINFTHGAQYMMGAFAAWMLLEKLGVGYWWSLLIVPVAIGAFGVLIERTMLSKLYKLDHLYGLLLTFGLALIIQGLFTNAFGSSGQPSDEIAVHAGDLTDGTGRKPATRGICVGPRCLPRSPADPEGRLSTGPSNPCSAPGLPVPLWVASPPRHHPGREAVGDWSCPRTLQRWLARRERASLRRVRRC